MPEHDDAVRPVLEAAAAGDIPGLVSALSTLGEPARRAAWAPLSNAYTTTALSTVAAMGCAPGARAAASAAWSPLFPVADEHWLVRVLADRNPRWLPALAKRLLAPTAGTGWAFRVVRGLVRSGLLERPDYPEYAAAMVHGLVPWFAPTAAGHARLTVLDALRADPALLDHEVWALLDQERSGRALQTFDRYHDSPVRNPGQPVPTPHATWRHALATLTAEGTIDRDRLLDVTFDALLADRAAVDLTWYVGLLSTLAPDDAELAARRGSCLRLLAGDVGPAVQLGLQAAQRLLGSDAVPTEIVLGLSPVLSRPQKGTALAALGLLEEAARVHADTRAAVAGVAEHALDHPSADVRERARSLVDPPDAPGPTPARVAVAEAQVAVLGAPPATVSPIAGPDELVEVMAHLIEEADDPIEVERALDGAARFARSAPRRGASALAQRAAEVASTYPGAWSGAEVRADLAALALSWLGLRPAGPGYRGRVVDHRVRSRRPDRASVSPVRAPDWTFSSLVTLRIHEVACGLAGGERPLLSLPATADGAIPSAVLSARLATARTTSPLDLGLAVLRLPPAEYDEVRIPHLLPHRRVAREALAALAASAPDWTRLVGTPADEWGRPTSSLVVWADPSSRRGDVDAIVAAVLDRLTPLALAGLEANDGEYAARPEQATGLWPLMLPHHLDLLAAHAHPRLARALVKDRSGAAPLIEAVGRSPHAGGAPTASALVLALAAQETPVRIAAVDCFVARAGRGLLDAVALAEQVRLCLADGVLVGGRLVTALAEAARADGASAWTALAVAAEALPAVVGRRDAHRWVDLVADLSRTLDSPVALPAPFHALATGHDSTALGLACRRVLERA